MVLAQGLQQLCLSPDWLTRFPQQFSQWRHRSHTYLVRSSQPPNRVHGSHSLYKYNLQTFLDTVKANYLVPALASSSCSDGTVTAALYIISSLTQVTWNMAQKIKIDIGSWISDVYVYNWTSERYVCSEIRHAILLSCSCDMVRRHYVNHFNALCKHL